MSRRYEAIGDEVGLAHRGVCGELGEPVPLGLFRLKGGLTRGVVADELGGGVNRTISVERVEHGRHRRVGSSPAAATAWSKSWRQPEWRSSG